ncbi:MAG: MBL fold metallo-hydrolase [Spirochaetia bacterium]|jgi:L-ascorbate metabolism protein UlaG (beta-lactamase superfamily)
MNLPGSQERSIKADIDATTLPQRAIALWYLGQSGFVVKGRETVLYLDPYLSDFLENYARGKPEEDPRRFTPPLQPDEIDNADFLFGSHWHYDHIDPPTVQAVAKHSPKAKIVVPGCARAALVGMGIPAERFSAVEVDTEVLAGELSFTAIPSSHESLDFDPRCGYPYWGYVMTVNGVTVYHAGDCVPYNGLVERLQARNIDIAMIPINGRDYFRLARGFAGNFTYREAAELSALIGAELLVPMHFGMHMANTDHIGYLADYLADRYPLQKYHSMVPGEKVLYIKGAVEGSLTFAREASGRDR